MAPPFFANPCAAYVPEYWLFHVEGRATDDGRPLTALVWANDEGHASSVFANEMDAVTDHVAKVSPHYLKSVARASKVQCMGPDAPERIEDVAIPEPAPRRSSDERTRMRDFFFPKSTLPKSRPGGGGFMGAPVLPRLPDDLLAFTALGERDIRVFMEAEDQPLFGGYSFNNLRDMQSDLGLTSDETVFMWKIPRTSRYLSVADAYTDVLRDAVRKGADVVVSRTYDGECCLLWFDPKKATLLGSNTILAFEAARDIGRNPHGLNAVSRGFARFRRK